MTAELQLLLQCARPRLAPAAITDAAAQVVDWELFWTLAARHDLRSLCFWRLQRCPESIPPELYDRFRRHFLQNTECNLLRTGELFRIIELLESAGVPVAAFKGPVLAWSLYESAGMREFADLDILVQRRHMERARTVLEERGYRLESLASGPAAARFYQYCGQMEMTREHPAVVVDLHWDLAPRSLHLSLQAETLWPRLRTVSIAGRPVLSFDPNDQLLFAAWHGGKHGWTTLAWLADIAALLDRHPIDWDRLLSDAGRMRISRSLFVALLIAQELLQVEVPAEVGERMDADRDARAIARDAAAHLLGDPGGTAFFPRKLVYQFRLTEGWGRRLRLLWRKVTEPNIADWNGSRRAPFFAWYYLTRPFRLLAKYLRMAVARAPWSGSGNSSAERPKPAA
jgi:hypothetical protein